MATFQSATIWLSGSPATPSVLAFYSFSLMAESYSQPTEEFKEREREKIEVDTITEWKENNMEPDAARVFFFLFFQAFPSLERRFELPIIMKVKR